MYFRFSTLRGVLLKPEPGSREVKPKIAQAKRGRLISKFRTTDFKTQSALSSFSVNPHLIGSPSNLAKYVLNLL